MKTRSLNRDQHVNSANILLGCLLLGTPTAVEAQFDYTVANGTVTITLYTGTNPVVVIPSTINDMPVTTIGDEAFSEMDITSVTIPNCVASVGYGSWCGGCFCGGAFRGCTNLGTVTIPDSVTNIGCFAFANCSSLIELALGSRIANISDHAFYECAALTSVTIPKSVTSIGGEAFPSCTSLTNIIVDPLNSAYSSVDGVLFNQPQTAVLEYPGGKAGSYAIPNTVTSIAPAAFADCYRLTQVSVPNGVTNIGEGAFYGCSSLTGVNIPDTVTSIPSASFYGCTSLTNITLGSEIASIGDFAFCYCTNLISVTIPHSTTTIGERAFEQCYSLITVDIPDSVINIGASAFADCSSLTGVSLGSGIASIAIETFAGCSSLTHVSIPNRVTTIGDNAFVYCNSMTNLILGSGVATIGIQAFHGCYRLRSITIPNRVTSIGNYAFSYCDALSKVYFQGDAPSLVGVGLLDNDPATVYYLPGTTGWGSYFSGRPTALWRLPYPVILTSTPSLGVRSNQFGFTISWATNLNVVVEAATDLLNPIWSPVQTNTLASGWVDFIDPQWTNHLASFYRVRSAL